MMKAKLFSLVAALALSAVPLAQADVTVTVSDAVGVDQACVDAASSAASSSAATVSAACAATKQVTATYVPPITPPPTQTAPTQIQTKAGFCLDATAPAAVVQLACSASKPGQVFDTAVAVGRFAIAGKCLGAAASANGTQLAMLDCAAAASAWTNPGGTLKHSSGKCADIPGSQAANAGAKAQVWDCDGSGEQQFTLIPVGVVTPPPVDPPVDPPPATGAPITSAQWTEIATQRSAFGDPNDCKARVDAVPTTGAVLAPGGNLAASIAANQTTVLQTGTYKPTGSLLSIPSGKKLVAGPGQKPVIDISGLTNFAAIYVGNASVLAGVTVKNGPGMGVITYDTAAGKYSNGGLIYDVTVQDSGRTRLMDNGTGVAISAGSNAGQGMNWCVVAVKSSGAWNYLPRTSSGGPGQNADGGNSDGLTNNFGASMNTFIGVESFANADDGFDLWHAGPTFWYFSSSHDNGKVAGVTNGGDGNGIKLGGPGDSAVHKFYKTTAANNRTGGWNLNGNAKQPVLVQSSGSGNGTGDYINGMAAP